MRALKNHEDQQRCLEEEYGEAKAKTIVVVLPAINCQK